jgi:hypothetical protein
MTFIPIANESSSEAISNIVEIIGVRLLHPDKSGFLMTYATRRYRIWERENKLTKVLRELWKKKN